MIEERVQVVAVQGRHAVVCAASRNGACGTCGARGSCGVSALGKLLRRPGRTWKVANTLGAAVGDEITVGVPDAALLAAAFLAYLLPALSLLAGAAVAAATATSDFRIALGAGLGLVAGIVVARWRSRRLAARLTPEISGRTTA
jgi:sigma-E factor negative regulatory protein RseC